jgi:hypothetical protein
MIFPPFSVKDLVELNKKGRSEGLQRENLNPFGALILASSGNSFS